MKLQLKQGTLSKLIRVFIQDSSKTTGAGLGGLVYNTAGLTAYYCLEGAAATVAITLATATLGTWTSGGFVAVDATNMPGVYEIGLPNACLTGGNSVIIFLQGALNMAPVPIEIELVAFDPYNATSLGLTNLDTNVGSRMATFILPTNFSVLAVNATGAMTVGTNLDKTGYSLATDPWSVALPGSYAAGSAGYILGNNLNINLAQVVSTFTGKPGTVGQLLYFIRQNAQNKLDYDKLTNNMVLYEDDGTTAKMTYAMTDNSSDAIRGAGT